MRTARAAVHGRWVARIAPAIALLLGGCDQASSAGGFFKDGAEEIGAAHGEILCLIHSDVCGDVYLCDMPADNELGHVEVCVQRDTAIETVEAELGECKPTSRHQGLCYWHCDEGAGCNAFNGCWCPDA